MDRQAWFCPGCQKHHAPHVETCPAPATALPGSFPRPTYTPWDRIRARNPVLPAPDVWYPEPTTTGTPFRPQSYGIIVKPDPTHQIQN